jgi:pimeloyl-ACP methyl ester carboxylesterase
MYRILHSRLGRFTAASLVGVLVAGSVAPLAQAAVSPAIQRDFAPPTPNADPDPFYTPPASIPSGNDGDILRARVAKAGPPGAQDLANAWQVMYLSTNATGLRDVVTGTVLVPKGVADPTTLPVVGIGPGTTGPAFRCTVSRFINSGAFYEQPIVNAMLKAGYAVAITDYEGYHENPTTTYINAKSMGSALIDVVRAATRLPEAGLSSSPKVAFQGFSQGGGASMSAGQLASIYAPELNVVGVSGGGVPSDLTQVALKLNGAQSFGFMLNALYGLDQAYPDLLLDSYLNDEGKAAIPAMVKDDCTVELLLSYSGKRVSDYTTSAPFLEPAWLARVAENTLGKVAIKAPVFQYHATNDPIVPFGQAETLHKKYCALGVNEVFKTFDTGHITTVARGIPDVVSFMANRFAGTPQTSNCGS